MENRASPNLLTIAMAAAVALATAMPVTADDGSPHDRGSFSRTFDLAIKDMEFRGSYTTELTLAPGGEAEFVEDIELDDFDYDWDDDDEADWTEMLRILTVLETGSYPQKLDLFPVDSWDVLDLEPIEWPPPDRPAAALEAISRLATIVASEPDPWLQFRIAGSIAEIDHRGATQIMAALSRHSAPSIRATVIEHIERLGPEDPAARILHDMWARERTPWVRARLLEALWYEDDPALVSACGELMDDDNDELATVAIECFADQEGGDSEKQLALRALDGSESVRLAALQGLADQGDELGPVVRELLEPLWSSRPEPWMRVDLMRVLERAGSSLVVDDARHLAWSDDPATSRTAMNMLGRRRSPGDLAVLVARAGDPDVQAQVTALHALDHPILTPEAEAAIVDASDPSRPRAVRIAAVTAMAAGSFARGADFPPEAVSEYRQRFKPVLQDVVDRDADPTVRGLAQVQLSLFDGDVRVATGSQCGIAVEVAPRLAFVDSVAGASIRCHRAPGVPAQSEDAYRLESVQRHVSMVDRFDDGVTAWFALAVEHHHACWVAADRVRRVQPSEIALATAAPATRELDVAIELTRSNAFLALEEEGLVERFDEGDTLVGVRLLFDSTNRGAGARVREVLGR